MKRIEILPGIETSALGFGCAPILGAVDGATARVALESALDCGITHFDLARSYGYGQAEGCVGKVLKSRRDQVTIATKFGIQATELAALLAPLKPLLRSLKRSAGKPTKHESPRITQSSNSGAKAKIANLFHRRIRLTPEAMKKSLETSLRELGTDYVDFFFIHEPRFTVPQIDELMAEAASLKQQGKIRAFGLAIMMDRLTEHQSYLTRVDILQFNHSPGADHYLQTLHTRGASPNIFFSPFRNRQPGQQPAEMLKQLGSDFPNSITLCSMFNPDHIRANAAAIS